jgi:hypothetical protein
MASSISSEKSGGVARRSGANAPYCGFFATRVELQTYNPSKLLDACWKQ